MPFRFQVVLLAVGGLYYLLNLVFAVAKFFRGRGISPGSVGASIPLLIVLFFQPWPLRLRLALAPVVAMLEFSWMGAYWLLERLFPQLRKPS